ncbi:MAG TPA: cytochrome c oxidase subunit I [Polyangium sp.]|nr:cytochrome c oxidase subunit I [Polyangium sp.]
MANTATVDELGHSPAVRGKNYLNQTAGVWSWLTTVDHKRIGIMYLVSVLVGFGLGGIFALLVRLELLTAKKTIMDASQYNQAFTLHGAAMVFLFIIPSIPASLGNFFLPLMIGAKDVAFPRLNLLSLYLYWIGAIFMLAAIVTGGVDTGWTFYVPYASGVSTTSVISATFGVFVMGFSSILTGLNFIVTLHKLRAPGMSWYRMPLFLWSLYATSIIQVLATPVLGITLLLLIFERAFHIGIFDPTLGGDPVLFQHFFWFYSHPAVYIMILPGMGVATEILATNSQRRVFGYKAIAFSSVAIALVSFLVWGHHMFVSGQSELSSAIFSFLTFFVAIPSGVKMFNWLGTLWGGSIRFTVPMLYGIAFLFLFAIGGLTGLFLGMLSVDLHLHDTYFVVAHFHYVMMGSTAIAFFGGLHHWWPKMTGKMYDENLARVGFALTFIGFNWTFFTQFILGTRGMPRRYYNYLDQFQPLHAFSTYGSWVLGTGFLITFICLARSLKTGAPAPADPWGGATLEWKTASPPITENFEKAPIVTLDAYERPAEETA